MFSVTFNLDLHAYVEDITGGVNYYEYLMAQVPDYLKDSGDVQAALKGAAAIFAYVELEREKVERETAVSTAVNKLADYEKSLGLTPYNLTIDERRALIRGVLWGYKSTFQEQDLKQVIEQMTGAHIEIERSEEHGRYTFRMLDYYGKPAAMNALNNRLKNLLNAGYIWDWEYKYHTWSDVAHLTYTQAARHTWEGLRSDELE